MTTVTLSLISHTNVGKTTLARTLLRRDIGEVRDQAHVTTIAEAHPLIETADARLLLWDTPGFGDTARLVTRLRHERDPERPRHAGHLRSLLRRCVGVDARRVQRPVGGQS